jgi:hypothetical protein
MALRNWDAAKATREISPLIAPGVLGFYTHFEATEVFAQQGQGAPFNVFSILVAEERLADAFEKPDYLTPKPIRVKLLPGWNFGIKRYVTPIAELVPLLDALCAAKEWRGSGLPLQTGDLVSIPTQFVPPDSWAPSRGIAC